MDCRAETQTWILASAILFPVSHLSFHGYLPNYVWSSSEALYEQPLMETVPPSGVLTVIYSSWWLPDLLCGFCLFSGPRPTLASDTYLAFSLPILKHVEFCSYLPVPAHSLTNAWLCYNSQPSGQCYFFIKLSTFGPLENTYLYIL